MLSFILSNTGWENRVKGSIFSSKIETLKMEKLKIGFRKNGTSNFALCEKWTSRMGTARSVLFSSSTAMHRGKPGRAGAATSVLGQLWVLRTTVCVWVQRNGYEVWNVSRLRTNLWLPRFKSIKWRFKPMPTLQHYDNANRKTNGIRMGLGRRRWRKPEKMAPEMIQN